MAKGMEIRIKKNWGRDMCNECMSARLPLKMRTSEERDLLTVFILHRVYEMKTIRLEN